VEFDETPTFIQLVRIEENLSKILSTKVDSLTEESISPYVRPYLKALTVL